MTTAALSVSPASGWSPETTTRKPRLAIADRATLELRNPATGRIDPEWVRLRVRYSRPVG